MLLSRLWGNAVNAKIVKLIAAQLLVEEHKQNGIASQVQSSNLLYNSYEPAK